MIPKRRSSRRHYYNAPIKYAQIGTNDYADSRMYNYSMKGLYFEHGLPLQTGMDVGIVMLNYTPGSYGPEAYKFYIARIRWCTEVGNGASLIFGTGVEFLSKSHEIHEYGKRPVRYTCDLCGKLINSVNLHQSKEYVNLCPDCFKHLNSIPNSALRETVERFLMGNVI